MKKIIVKTNDFGEEFVSDIMWSNGASGVNIVNTKDIADLYKSDIIWDYIDENLLVTSDIVLVEGFFDNDILSSVISSIEQSMGEVEQRSGSSLGSKEITVEQVNEVDWVSEWKKYYHPMECGNIVVVPSWINYDNNNGKTIVKITPGAAFGTGEHETTKMCLEFIGEDDNFKGKTVLDAGTGSGILALAAEKYGATDVVAFDIDKDAIKVAIENATINNSNVCFKVMNILQEKPPKKDVVFANITADILKMFAPILTESVNCGGVIYLSGIIAPRKSEVIEEYKKYGFNVVKEKRLGDWYALKLTTDL